MALRAQPRACLNGARWPSSAACRSPSLGPRSGRCNRSGAVREQTELYNVDRVSKSEGLDALPTDYSKLPPALPPDVPELGPPLPGDLGPAIVASQQPVTPGYSPPGHDPEDALRKEADAAAASSVFFRSGGQSQAAATVRKRAGCAWCCKRACGLRSSLGRPRRRPSPPTRRVQNRQDQKEAFLKAGSTETRNSGNLALPVALSGDGRNGDRRRAGDRHQVGLAGRRDRH